MPQYAATVTNIPNGLLKLGEDKWDTFDHKQKGPFMKDVHTEGTGLGEKYTAM